MKLKSLIPMILALLLCVTVAFASGGSSSDPLISLSFLRGEFLDSIYNTADTEITSTVEIKTAEYENALDGGDVGQMVALYLDAGDSVEFSSGMSFVLTDGSGTIAIDSGEIINTTVAAKASNGVAVKNARYIIAEDSYVVLNVSTDATVFVDGYATINSDSYFAGYIDVMPSNWFFEDVMAATEMGLINGMTLSVFEPYGTISCAQVIKLAATTHEYYETGKVTLENGSPWYQTYADYALENGLIDAEPEDYNANVTRDYYIAVMYAAMPDSEYSEINEIADGAVPDVQEGDDFYDEIYAFYRAGIVTGSDEEYNFLPKKEVSRSEVATLVARMFDENVRKTFILG